MTQEQKDFLEKRVGQTITLVYFNKERFTGIYKWYVEDDDTYITLQFKKDGIGWSYPCKGLKEIQYNE